MYLVFAGNKFYPSGGGYDLMRSFDNHSAASNYAKSIIGKQGVIIEGVDDDDEPICQTIEWSHVYSCRSFSIVEEFGDRPHGDGMKILRLI